MDLHGAVLYHCGPVMLKDGEQWTVKAAGPTTSSREEPYQADIIKKYGVRVVIGKGAWEQDLAALKEAGSRLFERHRRRGAILRANRGARAGVHLMEFGIPEAMWHLRVNGFAAIVTMDAHGNSLHADVEKRTGEALAALAPFALTCNSTEIAYEEQVRIQPR